MDKIQKAVAASLIATSALAWIASINQPDMMVAMTSYNPLAISLFTASWTAGMAAMMFPAITPMVLMYNRFVTNRRNNRGNYNSSVTIQEEKEGKATSSSSSTTSFPSFRVVLFVGSYLLVWALTGITLLLGWSVVMNNTIMTTGSNTVLIQYLYGSLLIIAGAYQFTLLKRICIGYCESPMSFFMHRWRDGTSGAFKMGVYHGIYCLGCCWAYFLLMVALGWMNLLWMGLFAGIIFGEKMWSRGIWIARAAGIVLAITGVLVTAGMLPSLISSVTSMSHSEEGTGGDMSMMMKDDNAGNNNNNNNNMAMMSDSSSKASMDISDDSMASMETNDESDHQIASDHNNGQSGESIDNNNNGNGQGKMMDME
jgi:predicted metal-binding membrane protein